MKSISLIAKVAVAAVMVVGLGACGKKSSKSSVGVGYATCTTGMNPYTNQPCQIGSTIYTGGAYGATQTCTTGINPYTQQYCQIGTPIYGGGVNTGYQQQYGYQQSGCEQANAMYPGHYYQPVNMGYGMVCQLVY